MKNRVVIFTSNNARIILNPENIELYRGLSNAVINPDLEKLKGIEPHFWKLVGGKIEPMSVEEKDHRLQEHRFRGVDNVVPIIRTPQYIEDFRKTGKRWALTLTIAACITAALIIGALIYVQRTLH